MVIVGFDSLPSHSIDNTRRLRTTMDRLEKLLKLVDAFDEPNTPDSERFPFGGKVVIRTVTFYYTGMVRRIAGGFVVLGDAAWIADTGRWSDFLAKGIANEVEPFPDEMAISLGSIVDVAPWGSELPRKVK